MSAQDDLVNAQLDLLQNMQLEGMTPEQQSAWQQKIDDIKDQYQEARRIEGDTKATEAQRKYAKDVGESIAKGLPLIAKGLQSAITAFQKGDAISGSAAIMDICAAAAPIIAAIFSATGPEGMLVGAIFSIIGQILALFMPKQPSMLDQIKELLQALNTEDQLKDLGAVHLSLEEYDLSLTEAARKLAEPTGVALLIRADDTGDFDDATRLTGKRIVVAGKSGAIATAKSRYPQCTIVSMDEVAGGQVNPREYVVKRLLATREVDALRDVDVTSRFLCETYGTDVQGGLAVVDVHSIANLPSPVLAMPLLTEDDADAFEGALGEVNLAIKRSESKFDVPQFTTWEVASWLKMPEKINYPRWPEVLAVWCRTYDDLIASRMKFNSLLDPDMLDAKIRYTYETNTACPLPKLTKQAIHEKLINVRARAADLRREARDANTVALGVLDAVTTTAQAWGMLAFTGTDRHLYFNSGPANIMDDSRHKLGTNDSNPYHRLAFVPEAGFRDKVAYQLKPRYHSLILGSNGSFPGDRDWSDGAAHDWLLHHWVQAYTFDMDHGRSIRDLPVFTDVCAAQLNIKQLDCWVGVHDGIESGSLDAADQYNSAQYTPGPFTATRAFVEHVRVVYPVSESVLENDPDKVALAPGSAGLDRPVVYAGLRDSSDIFVSALNASGYVPSPWSDYVGIAVDKQYLWVYHPWGLACATHASVVSCLLGKRQTPRWMQYSFPKKMLGRYPDFEPPTDPHAKYVGDFEGWIELSYPTRFKGLISMSPCNDGTIFASVVFRDITGPVIEPEFWTVRDNPRSYVTRFGVDVEAGTLQVDDWTQIAGMALQVHKLPIPCWPLMSSLKAKLELSTPGKS